MFLKQRKEPASVKHTLVPRYVSNDRTFKTRAMKQTSSSQTVLCGSRELSEGFSWDPGMLSLMKNFNFAEFIKGYDIVKRRRKLLQLCDKMYWL
jgi:hypothetical protein